MHVFVGVRRGICSECDSVTYPPSLPSFSSLLYPFYSLFLFNNFLFLMTSNRASLLAGLRTGGVRSVSGPDHDHRSQQIRLNPNSPPFTPSLSHTHNTNLQTLQMQMMQLEIMRLQARLPSYLHTCILINRSFNSRTSRLSSTRPKLSLRHSSSVNNNNNNSNNNNKSSPGALTSLSTSLSPPVPPPMAHSTCVRHPNPVVPTMLSCSGLSSVSVSMIRFP